LSGNAPFRALLFFQWCASCVNEQCNVVLFGFFISNSNGWFLPRKTHCSYCRTQAFQCIFLCLRQSVWLGVLQTCRWQTLRKSSPNTTCLYSAGSTLPLNLFAASQRVTSIAFSFTSLATRTCSVAPVPKPQPKPNLPCSKTYTFKICDIVRCGLYN
jgi:hypothetical protein